MICHGKMMISIIGGGRGSESYDRIIISKNDDNDGRLLTSEEVLRDFKIRFRKMDYSNRFCSLGLQGKSEKMYNKY